MTFPDSNALKVSLADLKDIVSRSRGEDNECLRLLSQIESLVSEIERKSQPDSPVPTPTSSAISQSSTASVTL